MTLIEHEHHTGTFVESAATIHLVQDPEQLEWIGSADDQVVIGVEPRVEVERTELVQSQQLGDDELDVRPGRVMARVEAHHGAVTKRRALHVRRAPVGHIGVVEGRLEELVLEHQPLIARQALRR